MDGFPSGGVVSRLQQDLAPVLVEIVLVSLLKILHLCKTNTTVSTLCLDMGTQDFLDGKLPFQAFGKHFCSPRITFVLTRSGISAY